MNLLYDEQVLPSVIKLAESARKQLILVSPYNDFSITLRDVVERAAKQVKITAVCRRDQAQKEHDHLAWLAGLGAQIHMAERLHAKIYMSESQAIVTSMNLVQGSAVNSKEIAFLVQDAKTREELSNYVKQRLIATAEPYQPPAAKPRPSPSSTTWPPAGKPAKPHPSAPEKPDVAGALAVAGKAVLSMIKSGVAKNESGMAGTPAFCIRCGGRISFEPERPLCDDCYRTWSRYSDPDYAERCCHRCQRAAPTSYARPLCIKCFKTLAGNSRRR